MFWSQAVKVVLQSFEYDIHIMEQSDFGDGFNAEENHDYYVSTEAPESKGNVYFAQ